MFYLRRAFRILPLYFLIILSFFTLSFAWRHGIISAPAWLMDNSIPRWTYLTFTHNFAMARLNSLGSMALAPTWSLAIEEQFYLTLPLIVWCVPLRFLTKTPLAIMAAAILVRIVIHVAVPSQNIALLVLTPCRADALILGALIAIAMRVKNLPEYLARHRTILYAILGLLILCVTIGAVAYFSGRASLRETSPLSIRLIVVTFGYTWFSLIYGTLMLIALTAGRRDIVGRICLNRLLRRIGTLSYCVYLTHTGIKGLIIWLLESTVRSPVLLWVEETTLIVAITFLIAGFSWTYFEQPLINYGHRFRYETPDESTIQPSTTLQDVAISL